MKSKKHHLILALGVGLVLLAVVFNCVKDNGDDEAGNGKTSALNQQYEGCVTENPAADDTETEQTGFPTGVSIRYEDGLMKVTHRYADRMLYWIMNVEYEIVDNNIDIIEGEKGVSQETPEDCCYTVMYAIPGLKMQPYEIHIVETGQVSGEPFNNEVLDVMADFSTETDFEFETGEMNCRTVIF